MRFICWVCIPCCFVGIIFSGLALMNGNWWGLIPFLGSGFSLWVIFLGMAGNDEGGEE